MQDLREKIDEFESMSEKEKEDETERLFHEMMDKFMDKIFMERKSYVLMGGVDEEEVDKYIVKLAEEKKAKYENYTRKDMAKAMMAEVLDRLLENALEDDEDETQIS